MTKKSLARQQRDALKKDKAEHLKTNTIWDDLNATYSACAAALAQHAGIAVMLRRTEVFPYLADYKVTVANIRAVTNDILKLHEELKEIHAQHANKTGGSDDPDEVVQSFQIYEQYTLFLQRHDAVVMPCVHHILEDFAAAEKRINELTAQRTAEQMAQDPNCDEPIDVVDKSEPAQGGDVTH